MFSIVSSYIKIIKKRLYLPIIFAVALVSGFVFGIIFKDNTGYFYFSENVIAFYVNALTGYGSLGGLSFGCLFTDICLYGIFFLLSFSLFLLPLQFVVVFYRGYVLGGVAVCMITCFSVSGFMLFFFACLIRSLCSLIGLAAYATLAFDLSLCKKRKDLIYKKLVALGFCFLCALVGIIAQLVAISFFLRPVSKNF